MINMVALMGRLTYEPELRSTPNGLAVIRFQIACDRTYQKDSQNRQADFIDCVAWRQTAEFISRYFHKGSMIAVEGTIQTSNYTDKDGNKRKQIEVLANNVSFCGSKAENGTQGTQGAQNEQYTQGGMDINPDTSDFEEIVDDDDDLPF
ncbi:single-stranded DNA-binding protein [Eubacterium sp.]|uniref:single-stranded DNA-binding protein n=1 Tax=Eubacterium sp. TaxID=142586 RepID=UPI0025C28635|nr:single-stranded DNA-binding protein [Eubacterium sp.]